MYPIFILFFAALLGIMVMVGRKVVLLRNGVDVRNETPFHPLLPDMMRMRVWMMHAINKYGYLALVVILRLYFRFINFLKTKHSDIRIFVKTRIAKRTKTPDQKEAAREASGFLKMMSEYKHKVRNLKHKIKEEEVGQ